MIVHAYFYAQRAGFQMKARKLMATLVDIEKIGGKGDPIAFFAKIIDAQEGVCLLQQQLMAALEDNGRLREQLEVCAGSSLLGPIQCEAVAWVRPE
jgi:hypothetical protein